MSLLQGLGLNGLLGGTAPPPSNVQAYQQYASMANIGSAQYQQHQYNQALMSGLFNQQTVIDPPKWVFNGTTYNNVRDMADAIWKLDCPEKTHFILKYE